jgi:hypothetical protein
MHTDFWWENQKEGNCTKTRRVRFVVDIKMGIVEMG